MGTFTKIGLTLALQRSLNNCQLVGIIQNILSDKSRRIFEINTNKIFGTAPNIWILVEITMGDALKEMVIKAKHNQNLWAGTKEIRTNKYIT